MIYHANVDEDREHVRRSRVLLDGVEQDISDIMVLQTGDDGFIERTERPFRLVYVMKEKTLATVVSRGRVEVLPR